jgi:hypothetical protein
MLGEARFSIPVGCTAASALLEELVSQSLSPVTETDAGTNVAKSSKENLGRPKEAHANDLCCRLEVPLADGSFSSANDGTNSNANNCTQYGDPGGDLLDFFMKIFANPRNLEDKSGCCTVIPPRTKSSHPLPTHASSSTEEDQTQPSPTLKFLPAFRFNYIREVCVPLRGNSPQDPRTSGYLGYTMDHPQPSPYR